VQKRMNTNGLGERINEACTRARLSKRELARLTGVSSALVAYWARGDHVPNAHDLGNFVRITGVNGHWLLTGEGSPRRETMTLASPVGRNSTEERHAPGSTPDDTLDDVRVAAHDLVRRIDYLTKTFAAARIGAHDARGAAPKGAVDDEMPESTRRLSGD
jgi:hypothetical protein